MKPFLLFLLAIFLLALPAFGQITQYPAASSGGTGNVTGPSSAVANDLPSFADTTGKVIQDSGVSAGNVVVKTTPGIPQLPTSGLLAYYRFNEGSGTAITDYSNNGNGFTLTTGTGAPTWANGCLATTSNGNSNMPLLPAALSGAQSIIAWIQVNNTGPTAGLTPGFLLSSNATAATARTLYLKGPGLQGNASSPYVGLSTGNSAATYISIGMANAATAWGSVGYVFPANGNDQFYANGVVGTCQSSGSTSYTQCGNSSTITGSGQYILAGNNTGGYQSTALSICGMAFYSTPLTAGQMAQANQALQADVNSRPVSLALVPHQYTSNTWLAFGDSILWGYVSVTPWINQVSTVPTLQTVSRASIGAVTGDMLGYSEGSTFLPPLSGFNVCTNSAGSNDIFNGASTASIIQNYQLMKEQLGNACTIYLVSTVLDRTGLDAAHDAINAAIRQNAGNGPFGVSSVNGSAWSGVLDFAADPNLGADGASSNTTYFQDGTHPTNVGQTLMAAIASRVVNTYYGYGLTSANPTLVTTTYTENDVDVFLRADTTGGTFTVTLPTAIGPTGTIRYIKNIGATLPLTVAAFSGETIDGASTTTVAAGGYLALKDTLNSASAAGAHWEKVN